ncbi:MAG: hypothetical protein KKE77_08385 [Alphaproteobacteria bacterium]|nr:hypothetical protein [Alphaproteobacteria bacterium]
MFTVDFGDDAGGQRSFADVDSLIGYLREQKQLWNEHVLLKGRNNQPGHADLKSLPQAWANLESAVVQAQAQSPNRLERLPGVIQGNGHLKQALRADSPPGKIVASIAEEIGFEEAGGAAKFYLAPHNIQIFQQLTKGQAIGAIEFQQRMAGLTSKAVRTARDASRDALRSFNDDVVAHSAHLDDARTKHTETLDQLIADGETFKSEVAEWRTNTDEAIAAQREEWENKYQATYEDFTEKLKLESAVKLWNDRSEEHKKGARSWQKISAVTAVLGLIVALAISFGALQLAEWLFADAFVVVEGSPLPSGLRPTWRYEVIFASAATLLYLTMFFWIMRIVVRIYMTEHHLGIDAQSRSSMAETYLALTKEDAATDQDRAIVLASLFRPQADGIVKDDGLPAITPAAILSGLAIGKPGGSSS